MHALKKIEGYLYEIETEKIRRACGAVWSEFGGSFKEAVVDRALTIALRKEGLEVEDQKRIDIYFEGQKVGTYVIDKVVNGVIAICHLRIKTRLLKYQNQTKSG